MPWNKDSLGLEGVLSLHNVLGEYLTLVSNISVHVVDEEWLGKVVLVVGVWHGFEVEGHHGAGLNITKFVHTSGRAGVGIEELGSGGKILWEVWVGSASVEFLIEVNNVISLWGEESLKVFVGEDGIENVDLINGWLSTFISDSSEGGHSEEGEMNFPDEGMWSHQESESRVANEASGPSIVGSIESSTNLVEPVGSSHSVLPVVVLEDIIAVSKVVWISHSLLWLESHGASNRGLVVNVVAINGLGSLESFVVPRWVGSLSSTCLSNWLSMTVSGTECSHWGANEGLCRKL